MPGDDDLITRVLTTSRTWAVVGLSDDRRRTAYGIAAYLQRQGKRIVPVHPDAQAVLGEQGYASLSEVPGPIDVVDLFVRSQKAGAVVDEAIAAGAKAVWFQVGVADEEAALRAEAAGLDVVRSTCPHIEGPVLLGWSDEIPVGR